LSEKTIGTEPQPLQPSTARLAALKEFSPEAWAKAQEAKDQEEQENASPVPIVFPVHW
jgi:hypothetical protein